MLIWTSGQRVVSEGGAAHIGGMVRTLRRVAVAVIFAFGLIIQGAGMPVMAAGVSSVAQSVCHVTTANRLAPNAGHHSGMQSCDVPCVAPALLPVASPSSVPTVRSVRQTTLGSADVVAGLTRAPDPYPPRSPAIPTIAP